MRRAVARPARGNELVTIRSRTISSAEMPLDIQALLRETGALLSGHFRLSSGLHSSGYVQCALLLEHPQNATRIGEELAARLGDASIERIVAPALGGLVIGYAVAQALGVPMIFTERKDGQMVLRRGFTIGEARRCAVIEDVVTTGKSTREAARVVEVAGGEVISYGSILNRSGVGNPFDQPYQALLSLSLETWTEPECPLCSDGVPLDTPGSRFTQAS